MQTRSDGGSADSDATDVAVSPVLSAPLPNVTTQTPVANCRIASRKALSVASRRGLAGATRVSGRLRLAAMAVMYDPVSFAFDSAGCSRAKRQLASFID